MLRLAVDGKVLDALKVAVPKKNKAKERLEKYVSNLEQVVNSEIFRTRPIQMQSKKHYWASLTEIQELGGQIWSLSNIRTHRWLEDNGLQLVEQVNKNQANNITGEIAIIKFTSLITVEDDEDLTTLQAMTDVDLDQYLLSVPANNLAAYQILLAHFLATPASQVNADYDVLNVNIPSVVAYIKRLVRSKVSNKDRTEYLKALRVLRVAQINNNTYPQKKKLSEFGRTYYEGVSIQSVNKNLRKAILANCYEYDVKSSVVAWKLAFASELLASEGKACLVDEEFLAIYYYLNYKQDYFEDLQRKVFSKTTGLSDDKQKAMIKEAMTALSFGGKLNAQWKNKFGEDEVSSVIKIFGNHYINEQLNFANSVEVTEFNHQQARLDKFIIKKFKALYPFLATMPALQTNSGNMSRSKVLAWLYQNAETIAMDFVRDELRKIGVAVQANIHDAIVVDRKLSDVELKCIERAVIAKTNLSYFSLGETHYV
jgi:hypothetical protein